VVLKRRTERIRWTDRKTNAELLARVGEERNIITAMKKRRNDFGHVLRHGEELHQMTIEGIIIEGRTTAGRPRNSYISQLKKGAGVNILTLN